MYLIPFCLVFHIFPLYWLKPRPAVKPGPKKFFHFLKNGVISKYPFVTSLRDTNKKSLSSQKSNSPGRQQYKKLYPFQTLPKLNTKFLKAEVLRTLFFKLPINRLIQDRIPKFNSVVKHLLQIPTIVIVKRGNIFRLPGRKTPLFFLNQALIEKKV